MHSSSNLKARQPLLWAAAAFAAGIFAGIPMWRPPSWWPLAGLVFAATGAYFVRRRAHLARALGLAALFAAGALTIQVRGTGDLGLGVLLFADGRDLVVTAHVIREGNPRQAEFGGTRQVLDVETEQITDGEETFPIRSGEDQHLQQASKE